MTLEEDVPSFFPENTRTYSGKWNKTEPPVMFRSSWHFSKADAKYHCADEDKLAGV